jgi:hypothetical protein
MHPTKQCKTMPAEEKEMVTAEYLAGEKLATIARRHGCSERSVYSILNRCQVKPCRRRASDRGLCYLPSPKAIRRACRQIRTQGFKSDGRFYPPWSARTYAERAVARATPWRLPVVSLFPVGKLLLATWSQGEDHCKLMTYVDYLPYDRGRSGLKWQAWVNSIRVRNRECES